MNIELTDLQATKLQSAMHECMEIAWHYRKTIADEDSIVLTQNLQAVAELLHLEIEPQPRADTDARRPPQTSV